MSDKNISGVQYVGCCVKDCKYHVSSDSCCATNIKVENAQAKQKGETFCATFVNRTSC